MMKEDWNLQRWKEVIYIYDYLSGVEKKGSMENALSRIGSRYIKRNDFVISVMDEFGIPPPSMQIEKHLRILYNTFPGSERQRVDSNAVLCTYLSSMLGESLQKNPKRVFNGFCDIYSPNDSELIPVQDIMDILSIGCISFGDFEQCSHKLLSSIRAVSHTDIDFTRDTWIDNSLSRMTIDRVIDEAPSLLIIFRDQILSRLSEEKRLKLLKSNEDESIKRFHASTDAFKKRMIVLKWNNILYGAFSAWIDYVREESRHRLFELRMLYWKVKQATDFWRSRVRRSKSHMKFFHKVKEIHELNKLRKGFKRWILSQKIQKACFRQSDNFKSKALGFTMLRIIRFSMMKKSLFHLWIAEVKAQQRMEWAFEMRCFMMIKRCFSKWNTYSYEMILKRKEAEHKRWATNTIQTLKKSFKVETDMDEIIQPEEEKESKVAIIRKTFNADFDQSIIEAQIEAKRKRFAKEMKDLVSSWNKKWNQIEKNRVREVTKCTEKWLKTKEGQNHIIKYVKKVELELRTPSPESSDQVCINLSVLDAKLADMGILSDAFFEKLLNFCEDDGLIYRESFMSYLDEIGTEMTISQIRDIFNGVGYENNQTQYMKLGVLQDRMRATYSYIGSEGTRYKKFVSKCHGMLAFHNVATNKMVLEHEMTKKKMRLVAFDHFVAHNVIKERRKIYKEKKKDYISVLQLFSVVKIQRSWRAKKEVSKTRLRVLLNH